MHTSELQQRQGYIAYSPQQDNARRGKWAIRAANQPFHDLAYVDGTALVAGAATHTEQRPLHTL